MAESTRAKSGLPTIPRWLILVLAFLVLSLSIAYIIETANHERNTLFALYQAKSQFYAELIGERTSSMLESAEQSLLAIELEIRIHQDTQADLTAAATNRIRQHFLYLEQIQNVIFVNVEGELLFSIPSGPTPPVDIEALLTVHRDQWIDLHIEKYANTIMLSRRVNATSGTFAGILIAFIDPSIFFTRFDDYASADIDQVGIWDTDGQLLGLFPRSETLISGNPPVRTITDLPLFRAFSEKEYFVGGFKTYQNKQTIATIYQLRTFPFFIGVAFNKEPLVKALHIGLVNQLVLTVTVLLIMTGMGLAIHRQLNRRRLAENALLKRQSQHEIYQQLFENSCAVKLLIDPNANTIIDANTAACHFYGYPRQEFLQMHFSDITSTQDNSSREILQMLFNQEVPYVELTNRLASEKLRQVELYASPLKYQGRQLLYVIVQDITERRNMEAALVKARKMESAVTLAGGITHDFNNLLTAVIGFMEMAEDDIPNDLLMAKDNLQNALKAAEQAKDLTNKFLIIANVHHCHLNDTVLQDVIEQAVDGFFDKNGHYRCQVSQVPPINVKIDRELMLLTLDNLLTNAIEALPEDGLVEINLSIATVNRDYSDTSVVRLEPGDYARIEIRDQGTGIAKEQIENIFDPYFSSKARGKEKGMGLGLTLAYSVMQRHGGAIDIQSRPNVGTLCTLYLPLAAVTRQCDEPSRGTRYSEYNRMLF